jgi:PAS domain-containing protein
MTPPVPKLNFQLIFDDLPGLYLILAPDFTMVAVNRAYCQATMTTPEILLNRNVFDLFPDNPDDPSATGTANLKASLNRVLQTKKPDTMAVQRYDIRRPKSEG